MNKSKTVHPEVRIGHVHLKVADLERALAFYRDVLGFELTQRYGHQAAFLSAGGYHHHIGLNTWESQGGSPPHRGATGLYHVAIVYPTRAELADALRRLIKAGILKWTPKFGPRLKLDFSRTARCEKEQINETKTKTVQR
ncbi:MAG: VOC family protein, partial [Verrucomicrobia bacterium]|nr:VOC family protein [Verrucomicrobiota bacterium]